MIRLCTLRRARRYAPRASRPPINAGGVMPRPDSPSHSLPVPCDRHRASQTRCSVQWYAHIIEQPCGGLHCIALQAGLRGAGLAGQSRGAQIDQKSIAAPTAPEGHDLCGRSSPSGSLSGRRSNTEGVGRTCQMCLPSTRNRSSAGGVRPVLLYLSTDIGTPISQRLQLKQVVKRQAARCS